MGKKRRYSAKTADRHKLYEMAVQCPEADVEFLADTYRERNKTKPTVLREDFCGTAALCKEWVLRKKGREAIGVDLDAETLAWGRKNNVDPLGQDAGRVELLEGDVTKVKTRPVDILVAFNFSYCLFKERNALVDYFRLARQTLTEGGLFVVDVHGGTEATEVLHDDPKRLDGFTYVWEQAEFNPIDGHQVCHIHFEFPDGTKMRRAFSYDWRHYSLTEVRDAMRDAGFSTVDVYWEGEDDDGEGDGEYTLQTEVVDDPSWIVYVVGSK